MRNCHEPGDCWPSQESVIHSLKINHLELYIFSSKVLSSPEGYGKRDLTDGSCYCTIDYTMERSLIGAQKSSRQPHLVESLQKKEVEGDTMERSLIGAQKSSRQPHLVESLQKKEVEGAASIHKHSVELNVLHDGAEYQGILPWLWYKVQVVATVKGNGDLGPSKVLGGGGVDHHDLLGCEFLLQHGLIRVGATENVVDLPMSLEEVTLGILRLLLLISHLGHLENLICKTLESVAVSGLVLSLR
jgi:hypothetical protein